MFGSIGIPFPDFFQVDSVEARPPARAIPFPDFFQVDSVEARAIPFPEFFQVDSVEANKKVSKKNPGWQERME